MLSKGDEQILVSIALKRGKSIQLTRQRITMRNQYIGASLAALARRGYIREGMDGGYQLTSSGMRAIRGFLPDERSAYRQTEVKISCKHLAEVQNALLEIKALTSGMQAENEPLPG